MAEEAALQCFACQARGARQAGQSFEDARASTQEFEELSVKLMADIEALLSRQVPAFLPSCLAQVFTSQMTESLLHNSWPKQSALLQHVFL